MRTAIASPADDDRPQPSTHIFYVSLEGRTVPQLKAELAKALGVTAENFARLAAIVRRLEEAGEDLSGLKLGILPWLRLIANGQVLPELVAKYAGNRDLVERAMRLPLPDQKRLADGEPLRLLVMDSGRADFRLVSPADMTRSEIQQAIGPNFIRDDAQQRGYLQEKNKAGRVRTETAEGSDVTIDKKRGGIVAGGVFIPRADLADYLARLERTGRRGND